ncbi:MAG: DcaP family trimeric outer membrane transporter [Bacteroidales bacterium]|nr:DcaP family trimeric outer membrane transporter [Bacteroidales bacterium]
MKIFKFKSILFFITVFNFCLIPNLKSRNDDKSLLFFIAKDTVKNEIMGYFYRTQSPLYTDPLAPRFVVASRNQNFMMGIGGYIMARAFVDFDGISTSDDFLSYNIPIPMNSNQRSQFNVTAASSRIFTRIIGNTKKLGKIVGYIEGDFLGSNRTFRLRHAYITLNNFTFGQTGSFFTDPYSFLPSVDQNGSIAFTSQRNPLIGYSRNLKNGFGFGLALEQIGYTGLFSAATKTESAYPKLPAFPAYIQFGKDGSHIRLTGVVRGLTYHDVAKNNYPMNLGVGGKVSWKLVFNPTFLFLGQAYYGKGGSNFTVDLSGKNLDIIPCPKTLGRMQSAKSAAWYGGFRINYSKIVHSSISYSRVDYYATKSFKSSSLFESATTYKYGQNFCANIIWDFISSTSCGIEYWWGERVNYDGSKCHANRIYTMIRYNF